jgi:anaerobic sulfite reductase subunit B
VCKNPLKPLPHKLISIRKLTEDEWTFRIEVASPPIFGQFYEVSLPRIGEMPISASGVGDGWIEMTIRNVGKVSSEIHKLRPGSNIFLRGPYGNGFSLDDFKGKHVVVAAGGCGVSPVRPLIEYFYDHADEVADVDLLFGFKEPGVVLFKEDIDRWKTRFNTIVTVDQACGVWEGECVGLITEYVKDIKMSEYKKMEIVIVGPPIMMKFTAMEFMKHGVPKDQIIVSMERRMSCGIGKCGHCKVDSCYACLDGPVFRYSEAEKLID